MRSHTRQRPIRVLLTLIVVVPLVSLLALWAFAASVTFSNAMQEHNFKAEDQLYGGAAQMLGNQLAQERLQTFIWLSSGRRTSQAPMLAQFRATDTAVAAFRKGLNARPGMISRSSWPALDAFEAALRTLPGLRTRIESGQATALDAFQDYDAIADAQFSAYRELVLVNNTPLYIQAAASIEAGRALDMADRELTLVSGALAAGGTMGRPERELFAQYVASQRLLMSDALSQLEPSLGSGYQRAHDSAAYKSFAAIENRIVASAGGRGRIPVNAFLFAEATVPLFKEYQSAMKQDRLALASEGTQVGDRLLLEVLLAGGLGLISVVLSITLMIRFGRRINRELTGLQSAALELAQDKLPRVVERLSQGEEVDVIAEAAPLATGRIAEISRVRQAFSSVQRTAVEAAVGQARLRAGVSQIFRNLASRSQSLLHRQLCLLDAMERKTTEPETLAELFQLDHLTTRMRRHAEGLIILSGATPGRGWRTPVPVIDVLRGALAEVEAYTRVKVVTESEDAIVGPAVADLIHLLAELIENATTFSQPATDVTVRASRVARGLAIEVEDHGVGITDVELARANDRIANPPEFDLAESDRLGLFVVARIAAKHRIGVTLRQSPYGGTTAIVLVPYSVLQVRQDSEANPEDALPDRDPWRATPQATRYEPSADASVASVPAVAGLAGGNGSVLSASAADGNSPGASAAGAPDPRTAHPRTAHPSTADVSAAGAADVSTVDVSNADVSSGEPRAADVSSGEPRAAATWSFAPAERPDTAGTSAGTMPTLPRRVAEKGP